MATSEDRNSAFPNTIIIIIVAIGVAVCVLTVVTLNVGVIVAICIKYVVQKNTRNPTTNDITQPNLPDEDITQPNLTDEDITQPNLPDEEIIKTEKNEAYASTGGALGVGSNIDVIQYENIHEYDTIQKVNPPGEETIEAESVHELFTNQAYGANTEIRADYELMYLEPM